METLETINKAIAFTFFLCYAYQFFYIFAVLVLKNRRKEQKYNLINHRFAVLICARNEEAVIKNLIESINHQTYNRNLIRIFVLADNCTDNTARIARNSGAIVYSRSNLREVGKGYALNELIDHINEDYPRNFFDGYFVFDADNVLDENYIAEMNKTYCQGSEIITGYRNSKNYGDNWLSGGYALWFLRESRYLNHARYLLNASSAVSGTGFFFSRNILEKMGREWNFHLLTEDLEFTAHCIVNGEKIGFCEKAVLYDEQPTTFMQSYNQRLRWSKGYLQVFLKYGKSLFCGIMKGNFSCFDMFMNIMPAAVLTAVSVLLNFGYSLFSLFIGQSPSLGFVLICKTLLGMYLTMLFVGFVTTVSEWKQIRTSTAKKILYIFTFPLYTLTYIPISAIAIFSKVEWKPIKHNVNMTSEELYN